MPINCGLVGEFYGAAEGENVDNILSAAGSDQERLHRPVCYTGSKYKFTVPGEAGASPGLVSVETQGNRPLVFLSRI